MNDTMTKEMEIYNSLTEKFNPLTVQSKPKKKNITFMKEDKKRKKKTQQKMVISNKSKYHILKI